jgi:hypothetical protein
LAGDAEAGEAREEVGFREHIDNPIVFVLLIVLAVYAAGAAGRALAAKAHMPGLVAFFGG